MLSRIALWLFFALSSQAHAESSAVPLPRDLSTVPLPRDLSTVPLPRDLSGNWRQKVLDEVRAAASLAQLGDTAVPHSRKEGPEWQVHIELYRSGRLERVGHGYSRSLSGSARLAGFDLVARGRAKLKPVDLSNSRLLITVEGGGASGKLISFGERALEVVGDVTAVRTLNRDVVSSAMREQRDYLLRQMHPQLFGFYKLYDARVDVAETKLRATYTASALWTLLVMNEFERDPRIEASIEPIANYLLSMQAKEGPQAGAFHYSYDIETQQKELRFVVGTTSKSIYTLLELYRLKRDPRYLQAAVNAGNWLVRRVRNDGRVYPVAVYRASLNSWRQVSKQSVLYSSETLSALSRLSLVLRETARDPSKAGLIPAAQASERSFARDARRIARRLLTQGEAQHFFIGDHFRRPNSISTSWLAMSLLDYSQIDPDPRYQAAIYRAAQTLVGLQLKDPKNVLEFGRYQDTFASSGNGWMNEVMVQIYQRCRSEKRADCQDYGQALVRNTRWLIQNIYRPENSFHILNPERARGGSIRDSMEESVRTDAVCHGGNSIVGVLSEPSLSLKLNL